jgi:hypothetical protein
LLYTPQTVEMGPISAKGKNSREMFVECALHKSKGREFVEKVGGDIFHSEDELHQFFAWVGHAAVAHIDYSGSAAVTGPDGWLLTMPTDKSIGWGASELEVEELKELEAVVPIVPTISSTDDMVSQANQVILGWKDTCRNVTVHLPEGRVSRLTNPDGSLVTMAAQRADRPVREGLVLDHNAGGTEHTMIIN